jgi:hypothetical protein
MKRGQYRIGTSLLSANTEGMPFTGNEIYW